MNEFQHRVTKEIRILAVVEPPRHLVKVGRQMLCRDAMPSSHDAALEQAERRLYRVRVDVAGCPTSRGFRDVGRREPSNLRNLTPDFFITKPSEKSIDLRPVERDDRDLIGAVSRSARPPRRPSKLPQTHFQRSLTT